MIEVSLIWLVLPNGDAVLQRRDQNTNISPGLLGLFGGHIEAGEAPEAAIKRELSEETSLNVAELDISWIASVVLPHPNDSTVKRRLHIYRAAIDSDDFAVFEGERSETYSIVELKARQDLAPSAAYVMNNLITLQPAHEKDKTALSKLLHDYQLELLNEAGEYKYLSNYFTDPDRWAFFICVDNKVAGFVFVNKHTLIEENAHSIAEFYVVPSFRRQGVGERAAELAFRQFPGTWEVAQMAANQPAIRFWRKVVSEVTGGTYNETTLNSDAWRGPVQTFRIN